MRGLTRHTLWLFSVAVFAGCAALQGAPDAPRPMSVATADPEYLVEPARLALYNAETDREQKQLVRNDIIDERILEIDTQFHRFELTLSQQGIGVGVGTDWVQLAISAATATVGGEALKSVLGAVSTGLTGAKVSLDKHAFFDKTLPALVAQMVAEREKIRANIERSKQLPVAEYTLFAALSDLRRLMRAGTILGGIQTVAGDAGAKAATADKELKAMRTARFQRDDAGDRLRTFWKPDGQTIDRANAERLKQWMQANGLAAGPGDILLFLRSAELADLRARAVRDLLTE